MNNQHDFPFHALIKVKELDVFLDIHKDNTIQFRAVYLTQFGLDEIVMTLYAPTAKALIKFPGVTVDTHIQIYQEREPNVMSHVATVRLAENMHL